MTKNKLTWNNLNTWFKILVIYGFTALGVSVYYFLDGFFGAL